MTTTDQPPRCDTCDGKMVNDGVPGTDARRLRFLDAYRERGVVAPAARLVGVHRATVYRWLADPAFAAEMRAAMDDFFRRVRAEAIAAEDARRRWREERERARRLMRCANLAKARSAKRY